MRIVIARVLSLRIDQSFFRVVGDTVSVTFLPMSDGLLRVCDGLPEMVIGIAEH